jgi:hypothetical protein
MLQMGNTLLATSLTQLTGYLLATTYLGLELYFTLVA